MVAIFESASALLTPEFVESFDPEKLASKFVKVEKEYGVKFSKTSRTFNIVGHWEAVRNAHKSLQKLMGSAPRDEVQEEGPEVVVESPEVDVKCEEIEPETEDCEPEVCETGQGLEKAERPPTPDEPTVYKIKGNPKRGRYAGEPRKSSALPEPVVFFQYQDKSFTEPDKFNMDNVLDEFERGQIDKRVTKEDLKKILEKNTKQMGRPLNKGLPRGALLPLKKLHLKSLAHMSEQHPHKPDNRGDFASRLKMNVQHSALGDLQSHPNNPDHQADFASHLKLNVHHSSLGDLQSQPGNINANLSGTQFTLVQPGAISQASGVDSSNALIFQGQERFFGNYQDGGMNDNTISWLSYNNVGFSCESSEVRDQGQVMEGNVINITGLPSLTQTGAANLDAGSVTDYGEEAKALLDDMTNQLAAEGQSTLGDGNEASVGEEALASSVKEQAIMNRSTQSNITSLEMSTCVTAAMSSVCSLAVPSQYSADNVSSLAVPSQYSADNVSSLAVPNQYSADNVSSLAVPSQYSADNVSSSTVPSQYSADNVNSLAVLRQYSADGISAQALLSRYSAENVDSHTGLNQYSAENVDSHTGLNQYSAENVDSPAALNQYSADSVDSRSLHSQYSAEKSSSPAGLRQYSSENISSQAVLSPYSSTTDTALQTEHEWTQEPNRQSEVIGALKSEISTENPTDDLRVEGKQSQSSDAEMEGKSVAMETTGQAVTLEICSKGTKDSSEDHSVNLAMSQSVPNVKMKPVKAKRKSTPSKSTKKEKESQSAGQTDLPSVVGQTGPEGGENQDTVKMLKMKKSRTTKPRLPRSKVQKTKPTVKQTESDIGMRLGDQDAISMVPGNMAEGSVDKEPAPSEDGSNRITLPIEAPKTKQRKAKAEPKVYCCSECDYKGCRKKRLTEHMGRVHGLLTENCRGTQEKTTFPCDLCDKSFVFGKDLNRHKKIVHHGQVHFCSICQKTYKSKYVFDKHMTTHEEGYVQPMFPCKICERQFTTKFSLSCHIKSEHLGLKKTFICPTCGKTFSQIRSYKQHANVHAGIRPYVCEICGKSFTYDKSLKEHRYMHDNIRRFPCTMCGKAFRQRTCLLIHMKVHKDSKDHICSSCGKGFTQKQSLLRHERIHTGDKPYTCKLCQKSFSDYAVIRKHMLMSHKKGKNDWKDDIEAVAKKTSDHYIAGGPGYVPREPCTQVREKNFATVIPPKNPGGATTIIDYSDDKNKESEMSSIIGQTQGATVQQQQQQLSSQASDALYRSMLDMQNNQASQNMTSLYQPLPSIYSNSIYTESPRQQIQEMGLGLGLGPSLVSVGMATPDSASSIKPLDIDGSLQAAGVSLNYGNLPSSHGFSGIESGLGADESMVAAFLKAQGRQSGLGTDLFTSLGSLAASSGGDQTQRGQGQLTFGLPSVAMTTNITDTIVTHSNPEVTTATSNISWGYPGYSGFYNSANFPQFQSSQQNQE